MFRVEADLNDVTDYVLALVANKRPKEVMIEELSIFMDGFAEEFVERLFERIETESSSQSLHNEEIEVDFEEEESIASGSERGRSSILTGRKLREYSPDRDNSEKRGKVFSDAQEAKAKVPCGNFQRFGKCRFGEACHYAHVPPRSSRLRLESLSTELQSPEALVREFKPFGSIVAVHVESTSATIQFSSPDEAEAALTCSIIVEPIKASLLQKERKQPPVKTRSSLPELLTLQKKQQDLLTRCIADQKVLFAELEKEDVNEEAKAGHMETLSKLSKTCTMVSQMLKSTTEMILEAKTTTPVNQERRPAPPPRRPLNKFAQPFKPPTAHGNRSLDLRPSTLRLSDLNSVGPSPDIHALQRFFAPFGSILSLKMVDGGEAAVVKYERHADAKKAYESIKSSRVEGEIIAWEEQQ